MFYVRQLNVIRKISGISQIPSISKLNNVFCKPYSTNDKAILSGNQLITTELKELMDTYPDLIHEFVNDSNYRDLPEPVSCFKNVLEYTVPTGKKGRALSLIRIYKSMEDPKNLTPQNLKLMNILAWCIELEQTRTLLVDDMIDKSQTRRGSQCWYKKEGVGMRAALDGILLENYSRLVIKKYFSHLPNYVTIIELLQEAIMKLGLGKYFDIQLQNINKITKKRYQVLARYKTTPLTFELPYLLARCLINKQHEDIPPQICDMLIKLGEFFQTQDDFRDCYDPDCVNVSQIIGDDIAAGKCTWLVATALEKATFKQRRLLEDHYGKEDSKSVAIVKELYDELELPREYAKHEEKTFKFMEKNIDQVSKITCQEIMFKRLNHLYEKYV